MRLPGSGREGSGPRASVELRRSGALCAARPVEQGAEVVLVGPAGRCTVRLLQEDGAEPRERVVLLEPGAEIEAAYDGGWR